MEKTFDYGRFPKNVVKILTDSLHGIPIKIKTKTDAIQLMALLGSDGALIPNRESDKTKIMSSEFELRIYRRCRNFLFGVSNENTDTNTDGITDGPEFMLTDLGYAACLFYFLSFEKPEFSAIIFDISKKTNLNACHTAFVNWSIAESFSCPDDKIAEFIHSNRNDQIGLTEVPNREYWMKMQIKKIRKLYNIMDQKISDQAKLDEIDKLAYEFYPNF